jgi:hypothetical protein
MTPPARHPQLVEGADRTLQAGVALTYGERCKLNSSKKLVKVAHDEPGTYVVMDGDVAADGYARVRRIKGPDQFPGLLSTAASTIGAAAYATASGKISGTGSQQVGTFLEAGAAGTFVAVEPI